jgi:dolichyl-phosphate-mannose-protein mannosyltransferase
VATTPPEPQGRLDRTLRALALAALAVRALYLLLEPHCALSGDEPSWIELGRRIARPAVAFSPFKSDLIFYPPLYPYLIGACHRLFGSMQSVLWVQVALGALLVPVVGRAAAFAVGPRAAVVAAALAAFYPELVWYSAHYWGETVFLLLLWAAVERTLAADATASWRVAAAAGLLWGLTTLTRELALYLVPIALVWLLRPRSLGSSVRAWLVISPPRLAAAGSLLLATVLTIAPWTIRNAVVFRAFVPVSTMGGLNLWQGNTTLTHLQIYEVLAQVGGPVAQDRYCRRLAWETIAARQPGWAFEKLAEQMPEFWKAGSEVLDHLVGRDACGPLAPGRLAAVELVVVLPYLAVLALALVGLARLRPSAPAMFLLLVAAAYNAAHVVAYATTRFRLPVMPFVFMLAAAVVAGRSDERLEPLRGRRAILLGVLVLVAAVILAPGLDELVTWRRLVGR